MQQHFDSQDLARVEIEITGTSRVGKHNRYSISLNPPRRLGGKVAHDNSGARGSSRIRLLKIQPDNIKTEISSNSATNVIYSLQRPVSGIRGCVEGTDSWD